MIRRLRNKFILIAMLSLAGVLLVIMSAVNIMNYRGVVTEADSVLSILAANDGRFPRMSDDILPNDRKLPMWAPPATPSAPSKGMTAETPYETRFFSVEIDGAGDVVSTNTGSIAAVRTDAAEAYALKVFGSGDTKGFRDVYRYKVKTLDSGNTLIVFVDCTRQISTVKKFMLASASISAAGIAAVFVLLLIFSGRAIKPIAESYEKQKRFITDSSHEIKTPLTVIAANTEVTELETGETEWTQSTKNQIKRLTTLTNSLTALARMDEEGLKLEKVGFSLSDAVIESIEPFKALAETTGKTLACDVDEGIGYFGNEQSLRQLVGILADNAFKYSDDGGKTALSLKRQRKNIVLTVWNTVPSIDVGKHADYFDRFYRADTSRSQDKGGFGIGLSVAKSIVEIHGGKITAESFDSASIVVTVTL